MLTTSHPIPSPRRPKLSCSRYFMPPRRQARPWGFSLLSLPPWLFLSAGAALALPPPVASGIAFARLSSGNTCHFSVFSRSITQRTSHPSKLPGTFHKYYLSGIGSASSSVLASTLSTAPSPPEDIAEALKERPWRTGLEPAEDVDLIEVSAACIEGTVPFDLVGTLYRNGAGRIRVGASPALRYSHWFDGDGMVSALTFTADGRCFFRQRYLQGKKFLAQKNAKEGAWGGRGVWTQRGGREGKWWENLGRIPDNPLNTNVLVLEGAKEGGMTRTLALCEGGLPFEFDPVSLAVRREPEDFAGPHGRLSSFFSAHPKVDPDTGILYNFGMLLGPSLALNIFEISSPSSSPSAQPVLLRQRSFPLAFIPTVHDFVLAGRFLIIFFSPFQAPPSALARALLGLSSLGGQYVWKNGGKTQAWVVEKSTLRRVAEVDIDPPFSNYHFVNAWEKEGGKEERTKTGDGDVEVEVLVAQHRSPREKVEEQFRDMYKADFTPELECETWRYVLRFAYEEGGGEGGTEDPQEQDGRDSSVRRARVVEAGPMPLAASSYGYELPTLNPFTVGKKGRFAYVNALVREEGFVDSVAKLHLDAGGRMEVHRSCLPPGCFAGEAVFVPRGGRDKEEGTGRQEEDDGYLLFYVLDTRRQASDLVILDAQRMERPPLTVIHLPVRVPYSYHGVWTTATFGLGQ